jgi:hypothetical protein
MNETKKSNNTYIEIMTATASIVDYMKQQVRTNLVNANNEGKINVSKEDLRKICSYIDSTMSNSFSRASGQLENIVTKIK